MNALVVLAHSRCDPLDTDSPGNPVKHPVHNYACCGDIEPDWEADAGYSSVPLQALFPGEPEGAESKGHYGYGQDRVRKQDREIERPRPALAGELYRAHLEVVNQIAGEKNR